MIKATLSWLAGPRHVWACTLVTVAALAWIWAFGATEPALRLAGLALQLLGVLTVAWGISETRAFFGRPTVASVVRSWVRAAPFLRRTVFARAAGVSLGNVTMKARAYGTMNPASSSAEDRLAALEENLKRVHTRISGLETEYDQEFRRLSGAVREESAARSSAISSLQSRLEAFGTGGIHISAIGVVWLFVGLILSTAGVEIARALGNA